MQNCTIKSVHEERNFWTFCTGRRLFDPGDLELGLVQGLAEALHDLEPPRDQQGSAAGGDGGRGRRRSRGGGRRGRRTRRQHDEFLVGGRHQYIYTSSFAQSFAPPPPTRPLFLQHSEFNTSKIKTKKFSLFMEFQ